ncbi:MAG: TonB-dependent receptor [Candidatus Heimdallarchaeota archaeon]|nr:TonB-dependent receptor [Candidatus Heimdallarchaeota archaeon]
MNFILQKKYLIQLFLISFSLLHTDFILASSLEDDFTGDMPIILSATRLAQPQNEAPVATTIIDRKMIEAMGVTEIPEIFRMVPGFQVAFSDGTIPVVTYHGLSDEYARRMQILIDGRSVYTPMFGGPEWADLPLAIEDIERIEVIRGPNAVTYGANSFQAVINIITRTASEEFGHTVKFMKGSKDTNHVFYRYGFQHENINTRISFRHQDDHGTKRDMGSTFTPPKFIGDTKLVNMFTLRSDVQIDNRNSLEVHLGGTDSWMEKGVNDSPLRPYHKKYTKRFYQMLVWRNINRVDDESTFRFSYNHNWVKDRWLTDDLGSGIIGDIDESTTDKRLDFEGERITRVNANNRLIYGASIRKDMVRSKGFFNHSNYINNYIYRHFLNVESRFNNLLVNTGYMIENNSITDTDLSPRLALNYQINNNHTIRASVSRAYRNPVIVEEFAYKKVSSTDGSKTDVALYSSGGMKPESIISKEIGYIFNSPENNLSIDMKLYKDSIKGIATFFDVPAPAEDNFSSAISEDIANINWAEIEGFETQLKYLPDKNNILVANYSYANIRSSDLFLKAARVFSKSIPKHSFSLLASHVFNSKWSANATYYNVGQMTWSGSGGLIPKYSRVDLTLSNKTRYGNSKIKTELYINNLFNHVYHDFEDDAKNRRQIFVKFTMDF